jgi:hypothetical protein
MLRPPPVTPTCCCNTAVAPRPCALDFFWHFWFKLLVSRDVVVQVEGGIDEEQGDGVNLVQVVVVATLRPSPIAIAAALFVWAHTAGGLDIMY